MGKYLYREVREALRYRVVWVNLLITPFFTFAPFVYLVDHSAQEDVLIGLICWYELNQLFFGISNCFVEERINGTFINFFLIPFEFEMYLLAKEIWIFIQSFIIILVTIGLFALLQIYISHLLYLCVVLIINGIFMYGMSVFYLSMVLRFRRLGQLNALVQQVLGFISGYTSDARVFPQYIKMISFMIPLTYMILIARHQELFFTRYMVISMGLSVMFYIIGMIMVKKQWNYIRQKGDMNLW